MSKNELNAIETNSLQEHESVIGAYVTGFYDVGKALAAIRDERLYRAEYSTFEQYLFRRWDMERAYAYRLISAAEVIDDLSPTGNKLPENERQARPLTGLTSEERREAWAMILESIEGPITAAAIEDLVEHYLDGQGRTKGKEGKQADLFAQVSEMKKMLKKMETRPELAPFCRRIEKNLKGMIEEVRRTYTAAVAEYMKDKAA